MDPDGFRQTELYFWLIFFFPQTKKTKRSSDVYFCPVRAMLEFLLPCVFVVFYLTLGVHRKIQNFFCWKNGHNVLWFKVIQLASSLKAKAI